MVSNDRRTLTMLYGSEFAIRSAHGSAHCGCQSAGRAANGLVDSPLIGGADKSRSTVG